MFDLTNRPPLVPGAAPATAEAIARTLARAGAVVYLGDIDEENGRRVADEIAAENGRGTFVRLNVADEDDCRNAAATITADHRHLDILVNNAGVGHVGTISETTGVDLDRLYGINVRGIFNLTSQFIGGMIERNHGVIINMASIGGVVAIKDRFAYCTTKFAVVGMTKCLALDHALQGIRANAVCPGRVETPFVKKRIAEYPDPKKAYDDMAATQALGRMGTPDEIAAAVLYLASDEAAFVTGTALEIDGGFSVGK